MADTHLMSGPPDTRSIPVSVRSLTLTARDGYGLGATLFSPRDAKGTVVVHGAVATPQRFYRNFAEFLADGGLRVLTYDYRGVSASRPPSLAGFTATMTDWARFDAAAAHQFVRDTFGAEPVASVNHSFGGQLVGLAESAHDVQGTVMVGAQLGYYGHWGCLERMELALLWKTVVPVATAAWGYLPGRLGLGEDLPSGVAREWAIWCSSEEYLMAHHMDARERFARFEPSVLFYSFTDDPFAPRRAVNALIDRLVTARIDHRRVSPDDHGGASIGHFGFFKRRFRDTLWSESRTFLLDSVTGSPPGPTPTRRGTFGIGAEDVLADLAFGRD